MKNKIDISSLNAETKKKMKQYHKRCCDLDDIVYKPFEINIKFKVGAIWSEGLTARAVDNDEFEIAAMEIRKIRKKYIKEVNK